MWSILRNSRLTITFASSRIIPRIWSTLCRRWCPRPPLIPPIPILPLPSPLRHLLFRPHPIIIPIRPIRSPSPPAQRRSYPMSSQFSCKFNEPGRFPIRQLPHHHLLPKCTKLYIVGLPFKWVNLVNSDLEDIINKFSERWWLLDLNQDLIGDNEACIMRSLPANWGFFFTISYCGFMLSAETSMISRH